MPLTPKLNKFTTVSPVIKTFDAKDLDAGLGFDVMYVARMNESGNSNYILSDKIIYSAEVAHTRAAAGTATLICNAPPYNKPKTAKGTAQFSVGTGSVGASQQVKAQLFHMRGAVATAISSEITGVTNGSGSDKMHLFELPITEKLFATGDFLRLTYKLITNNANGAEIGTDPRGRTGTFIGVTGSAIAVTVAQLNMPFKLR